jgi:hypothetical protein
MRTIKEIAGNMSYMNFDKNEFKEFCKQLCKEQREICHKKAEGTKLIASENDLLGRGHLLRNILFAPEPEFE